MSDFIQVIIWLKDGKKVRRKNWSKGSYIYNYIGIKGTDGESTGLLTSIKNLEATDWEIYGEENIIEEFNKFIEKWCGNSFPHLIDSDGNDGERFRDKLRELIKNE